MKIKPEERPAVIGLGAAIGAVLLFGAVRFLPDLLNGGKTDSAQNGSGVSSNLTGSPGTGTAAVTGTAGTPGYVAVGGIPSSKVDMYEDKTVEPMTTHDPFTPAVPSSDTVDPASVRTGRFTGIASSRPMVPRYQPPILVQPYRPTSPFPGRLTTQPSSIPSVTDPNSQAGQMILAGVIAGPQAVAVIHIGDRAYPLMSGERMPFDMSLTRITEDGIFVKQGKKTWFIQVGKSLSASMPTKAGMSDFKAPGSMAPTTGSGSVSRLTSTEGEQPADAVESGTSASGSSAAAVSARTQP